MQVLHYQRRPRPNGNYSLEFIFDDVRARLANRCNISVRHAPVHSNGLFRRLAIIADAGLHQRQLTHVTGDINFAILGVRKQSAVLTILDCVFVNRSSGIRNSILKKFWLDLPVKRSNRITTISEFTKREIVELTQCDPRKIVVIPVAISDQFQASPKPFNEHCPRVLHIGTAPNKNLDRLISALEGIDCRLSIIGKIPDQTHQQLVQSGIRFDNPMGLTQFEVVEQYQNADFVCFASTYEGFGMPILEAQAIGRPVITSLACSMPEVAGDAACLVDPFDVSSIRDGILRVIKDATYRDHLVTCGFANVKRFDADHIANQYFALYRELAGAESGEGRAES